MKRLRNATKCSALLILPGIASLRRSSGKAISSLLSQIYALASEWVCLRLTWVGHEGVFLASLIRVPQSLHQFEVLVLELLLICVLHFRDFPLKVLGPSRGFPKGILGDIRAERFDADVVDVVGFVKNDDAVLRELPRYAFGDLRV